MFPPENECTPTIPHPNSTMEFEVWIIMTISPNLVTEVFYFIKFNTSSF